MTWLRLLRSGPRLMSLALIPASAIALFTLLARRAYLAFPEGGFAFGPLILVVSIVPFAIILGMATRDKAALCGAFAFIVFQSAPYLFWPRLYGDPIGFNWGVNISALRLPQELAPLLALALWIMGTCVGFRYRTSFWRQVRR